METGKKYLLIVLAVTLLLSGIEEAEASIVVEFSEVELISPTLLDGTSHFDDYGITFEDTTYWGLDDRLIGAGIDDAGIMPMEEPDTIMTVVFEEGADWVIVDWATITQAVITATAFGPSGSVLDVQSGSGMHDINHGSFMFSDMGFIAKITFGDSGYIAVGRLEFVPVPEPCAISLLVIGGIFIKLRKQKTNAKIK